MLFSPSELLVTLMWPGDVFLFQVWDSPSKKDHQNSPTKKTPNPRSSGGVEFFGCRSFMALWHRRLGHPETLTSTFNGDVKRRHLFLFRQNWQGLVEVMLKPPKNAVSGWLNPTDRKIQITPSTYGIIKLPNILFWLIVKWPLFLGPPRISQRNGKFQTPFLDVSFTQFVQWFFFIPSFGVFNSWLMFQVVFSSSKVPTCPWRWQFVILPYFAKTHFVVSWRNSEWFSYCCRLRCVKPVCK